MKILKCVVCGNSFMGKKISKKYCDICREQVNKAHHNEQAKRYYATHRDRCIEGSKKRYRKNIDRNLKYARDYGRSEKGKISSRSSRLRIYHKMSLDDYNNMLVSQNGVCAICGEKETRTIKGKIQPLSVDHNHITDQIRGLLCGNCNLALGNLRVDNSDGIDRLASAVSYLRNNDNVHKDGRIYVSE